MSKQSKIKDGNSAFQAYEQPRALRGQLIQQAVIFNRELEDLVERFAKQSPAHIGQQPNNSNQSGEVATSWEAWRDRLSWIMMEATDQILRATIAYEDAVFFPQQDEETNQ